MLQGMAETKVSNTGGNFFLLFIQIHSPCTMYLPHFLFIILRMKGMNLPFAAIRPRRMGEMEEIGECYERG